MYPTDINNNMPIIHGYKNDNNAITVNPLYDFLVPDAFSTFFIVQSKTSNQYNCQHPYF